MKVIGIVGTRRRDSWDDLYVVKQAFFAIYNDGDEIVSGGCPQGGDRFAEKIAKDYQIPIKIWYAKWNKLGKAAGFVRNKVVAADSTELIACVAEDRLGGTEDTVKHFEARTNRKAIIV